MKPFLARDVLPLNDCDCCEGITARTPVDIYNRAGLSTIVYRVGTYEQFKQSMLAKLSETDVAALQALTTRDDDDFAIALLDAWAIVADVLTFYQERIIQESYLRTATERFSIGQLARLIGYHLRPGVAAGTQLAFKLDTAPGSPKQITIDAGTKVQSIPGKDEQPQMFETMAPIEARSEWNALRPRLTQPQTLASIQKSITVQGIATNIKPGDKLLILAGESRYFKTVSQVTADQATQSTRLDLVVETSSGTLGRSMKKSTLVPEARAAKIQSSDAKVGTLTQKEIANQILDDSWAQDDLLTLAEMQGWSLDDLTDNIRTQLANPAQSAQVYVFRLSASIFGYNAAKRVVYENTVSIRRVTSEDEDIEIEDVSIQRVPKLNSDDTFQLKEWSPAEDEKPKQLFLENAYKEIVKDSYVAIQIHSAQIGDLSSGYTIDSNISEASVSRAVDSYSASADNDISTSSIYKVDDVRIRSRSQYGLSGKTTQLFLDQSWWEPAEDNAFEDIIRTAIAYAQNEELSLTPIPITDVVQGSYIILDSFYLGLQTGQSLILTGERSDLEGVMHSEVITIKEILIQNGYTQITLQAELTHPYIRSTVAMNANIAYATHGETVEEILGSGRASQAFQSFMLRQSPLTYIRSAATLSGALSTLEIRVNGLLWHETPMLYGQKPGDRVYATRQTEAGTTKVEFGDGNQGLRLPTGTNNVDAKYRKGIGLPGNVKAKTLTSLMSRPLGLKEVTNPLAATGGEDGEKLADARQNAPLAVLTLDRVVSLQDYEDSARAFGGIEKALATWTWMGQQRGIFVTVAGPLGVAVDAELIANLLEQFQRSGDPHVLVQVQSYRKALFTLAGGVKVNPDFQPDLVLDAVKHTLKEAFSFEARAFGQGVALSEVLTVIQSVPGVIYSDLDTLKRPDRAVNGLKSPLPAAVPQQNGEALLAAELLTLDPAAFDHLGELP